MEQIRKAADADVEKVYQLICELESTTIDRDKFRDYCIITLM